MTVHTFVHSFLWPVETFGCARRCVGHGVLRHTEQGQCCPSGALGTGTRLDRDRPGSVSSEILLGFNFTGFLLNPTLSQPESKQPGLPKESSDTDKVIHRVTGNVRSPLTLHLHRPWKNLSSTQLRKNLTQKPQTADLHWICHQYVAI